MMLEVKDLNVGYGDVQVLWDVNLEVGEGEVVALVGSNGAGKTTLLYTISGLLHPMSGSIKFMGKEIAGMPSEQIVDLGVTQVPQGRRLFAGMTVKENIMMGAYRRKDKAQVKRDFQFVLDLFPRMAERLNQPAGSLSGGEQQMCAVARGLMAAPKLLMIDELSLGLAPIIVEAIYEAVNQVIMRGTTVLIVEQDVLLALEQADRAYVLDVGHIRMSGPAKELMDNPTIKEAYMGI
jgi:branched-chain amino acid transport system ATP-binding protein